MGLLSSTVSITRYNVHGKLENPFMEKIRKGLKANSIQEIDNENVEKFIGWTSFENPYEPDFDNPASFVIGQYVVFSMRIDKKSIPSKVIQKHYKMEMSKQLKESGRDYLSRNEKKLIKEQVTDVLSLRIPATPNVYDVLWSPEEAWLWFFSTQKAANEELEDLFAKSFDLNLMRIFPYTAAFFMDTLSDQDKDDLSKLSPAKFTR